MAKWVLVTGATAGIGRATAESFAALGYSVFLTGRRSERLQEIKNKILKDHPNVEVKFAAFDISKKAEVQSFLQTHASDLAHLDVLVNNAGLARGVAKMQEASVQDWEEMIDTNIKGLLFMTRGVLDHMTKKNSGHIVNLGSTAGRWTYQGGNVYCATKFAVRAISEGLRMDLIGTKIRVTNIEPGMVETEFSVVRLKDQTKADKVYEGMTPLKAQDIADTITWCVGRPGHVNIQELVIYPVDQTHGGLVARKS